MNGQHLGLSKSTLVRIARGFYNEHQRRLTPADLQAMVREDARYYLDVGKSVIAGQPLQPEPVPVPAYENYPVEEPAESYGDYPAEEQTGHYGDYPVEQPIEPYNNYSNIEPAESYNEYSAVDEPVYDEYPAEEPAPKQRNYVKIFIFFMCAIFGMSGLGAAWYGKTRMQGKDMRPASATTVEQADESSENQQNGNVMSANQNGQQNMTPTPSPSPVTSPTPTPAVNPRPRLTTPPSSQSTPPPVAPPGNTGSVNVPAVTTGGGTTVSEKEKPAENDSEDQNGDITDSDSDGEPVVPV